MTFQELYMSLGEVPSGNAEYDHRRAGAVAEIKGYIHDELSERLRWKADDLAEELMSRAEAAGRIYDDTVSFEVPSSWTWRGHAIGGTVDV